MSTAAILWVFVMPGSVFVFAGVGFMILSQGLQVRRTKGRHRR